MNFNNSKKGLEEKALAVEKNGKVRNEDHERMANRVKEVDLEWLGGCYVGKIHDLQHIHDIQERLKVKEELVEEFLFKFIEDSFQHMDSTSKVWEFVSEVGESKEDTSLIKCNPAILEKSRLRPSATFSSMENIEKSQRATVLRGAGVIIIETHDVD
ncbi:hypothetical protein Ancab_025790 [Ancistrocladus abbreviatus]